ncbi:PLP-dependent aminotransferase family protein [Burkholderia sp. JPY481]
MRSPSRTLHAALAARLSDEIEQGLWAPGQRLPSVRDFSRSRGVSVTTVLAAYRSLEDRRLIESRPLKGFFVRQTADQRKNVDGPAISPELADGPITHDALNSMESLPGVVSFGTALCNEALFPADALARCIATTARRDSALLATVSFSPGAQRLRESLASHAANWNCQIDPDEILITNGCVEAFSLCLQTVGKPGDAVIVESPTFYGYLSAIFQLGMRPLPVQFHGRESDALDDVARLAGANRVAACLLATAVSNPTGANMTDRTRQQLVALLDTLAIPFIEDVTFLDLNFDAVQRAAKSYDRTGNVLLCSSLSKTLAPGLRVGWVAGGRRHPSIVALKRAMSIGQPLIIQEAIGEFLQGGGYRHHLRRLRKHCLVQVRETIEYLREHAPQGTFVREPEGGYVLWVRLPAGLSSVMLAKRAYSGGITIAPGTLFSPDVAFDDHVRLNCGHPLDERRRSALAHLTRLMSEAAG